MGATQVYDATTATWRHIGSLVYTAERNLLPDFEIENGSGGFAPFGYFWKAGAPVVSVETTLANVYTGAKSQKIVLAAGELQRIGSPAFAVRPGSVVTMTIAMKSSTTTATGSIGLFTSAPTEGDPDFFVTGADQEWQTFNLTTEWQLYTAVMTIPAGNTKMRVYYSAQAAAGTAATVYVDSPSFKADETTAVGYGDVVNLPAQYVDTTPTAPTSGSRLFTRDRARRIPSFLGPAGQDSQLQPALFSNRVARLNVVNNVAAPVLDGLAVTNIAAPTAIAVATTNFYTSMVRHRYTSAATAGSACGTRSATGQWFLSTTANTGGFFFVARFGLNAITATNRIFVGMSATPSALVAGNNPSVFLSMVGLAADSAHTTFRVMHNDGSGTATQIDLGADFPTQTAATHFYEFRLFAPSGAGQNVRWSMHRLNDGKIAAGEITTDLPNLNTLLSAHVHHSNGTTATAVSLDLQSLYIETDN